MTQKELLYVEDAIEHENIIISILDNMIENLEDEDLVSFIEDKEEEHVDLKDKLVNLLKEKANE
jgi:hypothetical protein